MPSLTSGRSMMLGHVDEMRGVYPVSKDHPVSARFFTALQETGGRALLIGPADLAEDFAFYQTENGCLDAGFEPDRRLHAETRVCSGRGGRGGRARPDGPVRALPRALRQAARALVGGL